MILKFATLQLYISGKSPELKDYKKRADDYVCSVMPGVWGATTTRGGMLWHQAGSNMQHVTSAAFLLTTYAKHAFGNNRVSCGGKTISPAQLQAFAKRQVIITHLRMSSPAHKSDGQMSVLLSHTFEQIN